ncbi:hypothetical protein BU16DRAFT_618074 [Lophium mytilinum]|uniref:Mid2 domain-containing protein n=1 Tax=Lophium mytilinum TaxID=390894 RepID=A0A6A6QTE3_9PEZI|nr:hypothetical protein BU16DRAFT_618074 [Lophium mytilinum]
MVLNSGAAFALFLVLQHLITACSAASCFAFDGLEYGPDNQVCPGSSACCGYNATCLPNRLCHNNGDLETTLVRGPCAVDPWNDNVCAQICLYSELDRDSLESLANADSKDESDNGGLFPRVFVCQNGSLCCDNDRQCCQSNRGVFLDEHGNILTANPTSSTSTVKSTTSSSITSSLTASTSTQQASTTSSLSPTSQTPTSSSSLGSSSSSSGSSSSSPGSQGLSTESMVGLGVGVPFGIAVLIGLGAIAYFLRRRDQARSLSDRVELVSSARPYGTDQHASQAVYAGAALPHKPWAGYEDRHEIVRQVLEYDYWRSVGLALSPKSDPSVMDGINTNSLFQTPHVLLLLFL